MGRVAVALLLVPAVTVAAPVPKTAKPALGPTNSNQLVKDHKGRLTPEASTEYQGWEVGKLFDGDEATSWFSAAGDGQMAGTSPWVKVTFPDDVAVRRVTVLGNREPNYRNQYMVLEGKVELLDAKGRVLASQELKAAGEDRDFEFAPNRAVAGVRAVKFTCTKDQAQFNCVGLGEMQVE